MKRPSSYRLDLERSTPSNATVAPSPPGRKKRKMWYGITIGSWILIYTFLVAVSTYYEALGDTALDLNKDLCVQRSLRTLCSAYNDTHAEVCIKAPRSFFEQRLEEYSPLETELEARKMVDSVSAVSIGAGKKTGVYCDHAATNKKTLCTDRPALDLFLFESWLSLLKGSRRNKDGLDVIFAEHVLEHFDPIQVERLSAAAYAMLKPGGTFRIAVPDGYKPSPSYQQYIRPGSTASGAGQKHMVAWTIDNMPVIFEASGFEIRPREHWDAKGMFHSAKDAYQDDETIGKIKRSSKHDKRNKGGYNKETKNRMGRLKNDLKPGELMYTSLWFDAVKPISCEAVMTG